MSRYSEKVARREEAARLAELAPEEPEAAEPEAPPVQPEHADVPAPPDGLGEVPALDTLTPEQKAAYHAQVLTWRAKTGRRMPGSKQRRYYRAVALGITP